LISIDTNILVRFIVYDHEEQAKKARKLLENNEVCIPLIVLVEMVWVLESAYGFSSDDISETLEGLLACDDLIIENRHQAESALVVFSKHNIDYADAVIFECSKLLGCEKVYTFDKKCIATGIFSRP